MSHLWRDIFTFYFALSKTNLELSPHHFVDDAGVTLDDLYDLGRDVFFDVVRHRDAVVAVGVHRDGGVDGLQEGLFVNARDEEAGHVKLEARSECECRSSQFARSSCAEHQGMHQARL